MSINFKLIGKDFKKYSETLSGGFKNYFIEPQKIVGKISFSNIKPPIF